MSPPWSVTVYCSWKNANCWGERFRLEVRCLATTSTSVTRTHTVPAFFAPLKAWTCTPWHGTCCG
jgi:hypothetical protein